MECPPGALRVKPGKKKLAKLFKKAKKQNKKFIYFENGIHDEKGKMIIVDFSVTIIGASRDGCIFKGGFEIKGKEKDNVAITNLTIRESKTFGLFGGGGASVQLNKVTVDLCKEGGIAVSGTQRNTMTDCKISNSKGSGLSVWSYNGGFMKIDGEATTICNNCTDGTSNTYGLDTGFTDATINRRPGAIAIKSPLTKASISINNGGGGNWGGEGTITEEEPVGETKEEPSVCPPGALRVLPGLNALKNAFIEAAEKGIQELYLENGIHKIETWVDSARNNHEDIEIQRSVK